MPYIEVVYSTGVAVTEPHIDEGSSCVTGANRPVVDTTTPALNILVDDPAVTQVRADFELTALNGTVLHTAASASQASGTLVSAKVPAGKLANGGTYRWRTRGVSAGSAGAWTTWCEFTVDSSLDIIGADDVNETVPEELRDALGTYDQLAEANPDEFGYPDVTGDAIVVDVVTDEAADKAQALADGTLQAQPSTDPDANKAEEAAIEGQDNVAGVDMAINDVTLSRTEIDELRDEVQAAVVSTPALVAADVWKTEVDRDGGRIAVTMSDVTVPAAQALEQRFGDRVVLIDEKNQLPVDQASRLADVPLWRGGARIKIKRPNGTVNGCSSAFAWNITSTAPGMLTAAHCAPDGGTMLSWREQTMGSIPSGSRENYGSNGTVYLPNQKVYRGDMALANASAGIQGRIFRGPVSTTATARVKAMWSRRAQKGDQYCVGGSYFGEICGWTVGATSIDVYSSGKWKRNVVMSRLKTGKCTGPGDSGGPVYTVNSDGSVTAKGIFNGTHGGGSDSYGGEFDPCSNYFTDIWDAYYGFPGTLKTS